MYPEFQTPYGRTPLSVLSQGTQSVVHSVAQIVLGFAEYYGFPRNLTKQKGILLIDEIDAHLHPSWQKRFIPALMKRLPNLQIFCTTHSPLVLGGLKAGQIHLLRPVDGRIDVSTNETDIEGWTFDEVLRGILGVGSSVDSETEELISRLEYLNSLKRHTVAHKKEIQKLKNTLKNTLIKSSSDLDLRSSKKLVERFRTASRKTSPRAPASGASRKKRKTKKKSKK